MKKFIIIGILVLVAVLHFLTTNHNDAPVEEPNRATEIEWFERENQSHEHDNSQARLTNNENEARNTNNSVSNYQTEHSNELLHTIQSFINFSYDWNYIHEDRSLQNYVTEEYFNNVTILEESEILGGSEYDIHDEARITISEMEIFFPNGTLDDRFNVVVTFVVLYEVPPHSFFYHDIVLKLEIVNVDGNYYINSKIVLN